MHLGDLKDKIPTKERLYFVAVALIAAFLAYEAIATVSSRVSYESVVRGAVDRSAGPFTPAHVQDLLKKAQDRGVRPRTGPYDQMKEAFAARLVPARATAGGGGQSQFMRGNEQVFGLPPLALGAPASPQLPAYQPPLGDAPAEALQNRPAPPDRRPVRLDDESEPNPFD